MLNYHNDECHFAECRGALETKVQRRLFKASLAPTANIQSKKQNTLKNLISNWETYYNHKIDKISCE